MFSFTSIYGIFMENILAIEQSGFRYNEESVLFCYCILNLGFGALLGPIERDIMFIFP